MKEKQAKEDLEKYFTIDEIIGDTEWQFAQKIFLENQSASLKELKDLIQEQVIKDAMEMIDYRTNQKNDLNYISYLITYALLTMHYQNTNRKEVPLLSKLDYLGIHLALNNPDVDPIDVIAPLNDDEVAEIFQNIFLEDK